jgi:NAD(P)-dependent dehydrogenase (short-subunit alcohol dehydrogenase family)
MGSLEDKVIIVTGAGSGIGWAIAQLASREGATVVAAEIHPENGARCADEIRTSGGTAAFEQTDVADSASVDAMVVKTLETFGRIDGLVNNAGIDDEKETTSFSPEDWRRTIDINLGGTFFCSRACLPTLRKLGGVIVNMASVHAMFGFSGAAAYDASKGGIVALTRSLAVENGPHGIRVNAICPGYIDTPLWDRDLATYPDPKKLDRLTRENHPLGRRGTPKDVAQAARFLLSDESSWITGTTLVVDGGMGAKFFERGFE